MVLQPCNSPVPFLGLGAVLKKPSEYRGMMPPPKAPKSASPKPSDKRKPKPAAGPRGMLPAA